MDCLGWEVGLRGKSLTLPLQIRIGIETHGRMLFCKEAFDWAWVCGKGLLYKYDGDVVYSTSAAKDPVGVSVCYDHQSELGSAFLLYTLSYCSVVPQVLTTMEDNGHRPVQLT